MALKSSNKVDTNTYELVVTVDSQTFTDACKAAYEKQKNDIQIQGFRKGKAPQGMVEKMYGEACFYDEALNIVFPKAFGDAVEEAGLKIVDNPYDVDTPVISKAQGIEMTMKVTTYPEVKLGKYKGLKAEMGETEATDEDVENEINNMQNRNSRLIDVTDRAAQMGDTAEINFEGFVDGVAFDGGKGEKYPLELGSGSFIPGFEEQVAGHNVGDSFDVNVTFPDEYAEELAGKDATFKCSINSIKVKELPELNDDFAKDVSEFDTLDELKADLKKQITDKKTADAKADFENKLIDIAVDEMEAEIPECMYENKCDDMIQDYSYRLQMQGLDLKTYLGYIGQDMEALKEQFMEGAIHQVKAGLVLNAIVEAEKIEATDDEINAEIEKLATQYDMEVEKIKNAVPADQIAADIKTRKAIDFIVDNAKKA